MFSVCMGKLWAKYNSPANDHVFAAKAYSPAKLSDTMGGQIDLLQRINLSISSYKCMCVHISCRYHCVYIMYLLIHQSRPKLLDTMGRAIDWQS